MRDEPTPSTLLARALRSDPARPFVTYYDLRSGGRVELSVATFENWTNKTAGLLHDELAVEPEDTVSVVLPAHWLGLVWAAATWKVGARLVLGPSADAVVDVRAVDEEHQAVGELVLVNVAPLGGASGAAVPSGAVDYGRVVLGFPDQFGPAAALIGRAGAPGGRRLVLSERLDDSTVDQALLGPLRENGSVVLVRPPSGELAPERVDAIAATERAARPGTGLPGV